MIKQKVAVELSAAEQSKVWSGPESMHGLLVSLDSLRLDPKNARQHDERGIKAVEKSLLAFGQRKPIVVRGGVVVAGNGTLSAAQRLGWTHLAVVTADDLTQRQVKAYAIADNRTSDLSAFNLDELAAQLGELNLDGLLDPTGFSEEEMMGLLANPEPEPAAPTLEDSGLLSATSTSHVRMVQLFLDAETHPKFVTRVSGIAKAHGYKTITDVVYAVVEQAYANIAKTSE